jgi:hypothetical protein
VNGLIIKNSEYDNKKYTALEMLHRSDFEFHNLYNIIDNMKELDPAIQRYIKVCQILFHNLYNIIDNRHTER